MLFGPTDRKKRAKLLLLFGIHKFFDKKMHFLCQDGHFAT